MTTNHPRKENQLPAGHWFVAARTDQLRRGKTLARRILGQPVVLFRNGSGAPAALEDRCPHKNVALSLGRVNGDSIECRYHGWKIGASGAVGEMPCHAPGEPLPTCRARTYPVVEQDGWIWIWMGEPTKATAPPSYPRTKKFRWFELHNVMQAPIDLVLENGLDCSHTGFVHRGLFRSAPKGFVRAKITESETGVQVDTAGETYRGKPLHHVDELILPHTVKVDYVVDGFSHLVTILVATPEDEYTTRVYTRMGIHVRGLSWIAAPYFELLTRIIVRQDKRILHSQAATIRAHGGRSFSLVEADQPTTWLQRSLTRYRRGLAAGDAPRITEVEYRL